MKRSIISAALFFILLIFNSCYQQPQGILISSTATISGKVVGGPYNSGAPNVIVRIGDESAITDIYGNFVISNITPPCDIYVTDAANKTGSVFKEVSSTKVILPHQVPLQSNIPTATINVTVSNWYPINKFKVFFTDSYNINGIGENTTLHDGSCIVYLPDYKTVAGKLCILMYSTDNDGAVTAYNKFGYIDNFLISPNSNQTIVIPDSIFKYNPGSKTVSGTITNIPVNYSSYSSSFVLSLTGRHYDYNISSASIMNNIQNNFSFLIPASIPAMYTPLLYVNLYDSTNAAPYNGYLHNALPREGGSGLVVQIPTNSVINSPANYSQIDSGTVINHSLPPGSYSFISHFVFKDSVRTFNVYTNTKSISFRNLWKFGLGNFSPGTRITFSANVLGYYSNMENFLSYNDYNIFNCSTEPVTNTYFIRSK